MVVVGEETTEVRKFSRMESEVTSTILTGLADDHDDRFNEPFESPEERLKKTIIKFGDVVRTELCGASSWSVNATYCQDTEVEAPRLSKHLREIESPSIATIADGIRTG